MSLHNLIINLISGITDPRARSEIAATLRYLYEVYASGRAGVEEIRNDLFEVCSLILSLTRADLTEEEIRNEAWKYADELLRSFKLESLRRRMFLRYAPREGGGRGGFSGGLLE